MGEARIYRLFQDLDPMPSLSIHEIEPACTTCCNCVGCKRQSGKAIAYMADRDSHNLVSKKFFGEVLEHISTSLTQLGLREIILDMLLH